MPGRGALPQAVEKRPLDMGASPLDYRYCRVAVLATASLLFLTACGPGSRTVASRVPPPPVVPDTTPPPSTPRPAAFDAMRDTLTEARELSRRAETLLRDGLIDAAREEFEQALDLLKAYATNLKEPSFRIEREIDFLIVRMATLETTQRAEQAAIDELAEFEPSAEGLDPALRARVEADVEAVEYDIPIEINDRVLSMLDYYTDGRGRSTIEAGLERVGLYRPMIERIFAAEGVPLDLIHLAQAESLFKPQAVSSARAKGMWQFISSRGEEYGMRQNWWIDERSDPEKSTRAAARHLKDLYNQFGDWYLAMAAYNSGPARVSRAMARTGAQDFWSLADARALPRETRNYVPTIVAMTLIGKNPERYGFDVKPADPLLTERIRVPQATDLRIIADYLDVPLEQIQELNPHVLRWATPPDDREFELILPAGYATRFAERVAGLSEQERILFRHHVVVSGETLSHIALRYGVSVPAISESNRLSGHLIRIGQSLVIPISGVPVPSSVAGQFSKNPPTRETAPEVYLIRRGDTLSAIAERFDLTMADIRVWNGMTSNHLIAGDRIRLSPGETASRTDGDPSQVVIYRVRPGDTLSKIALSYQTSVEAIREWNRHADLSIIRPGDRITIFRQR